MKKNTKFLFIYVAILFSFALMLILFAGLTQNNYAKELAESQGIKDNLIELTKTNQALTDSVNLLKTELDESKLNIDEQKIKIDELTKETKNSTELIEILKLYENGNKTEALKRKEKINTDDLTQTQLYIYNKIK